VSKSYQQSIVAEQVLEGACIGNWCSLVGNLDMLFLFTQWQHRTGGGQACPLKISEIILLNSNVFLFGYGEKQQKP